jgi:hypothetical protein
MLHKLKQRLQSKRLLKPHQHVAVAGNKLG